MNERGNAGSKNPSDEVRVAAETARSNNALHLTGRARRLFETSRSVQPARQVNAVVRRKKVWSGGGGYDSTARDSRTPDYQL